MKNSLILAAALATLALSGCDRPATVVSTPAPSAAVVAVPGPAGPPGASGTTVVEVEKNRPPEHEEHREERSTTVAVPEHHEPGRPAVEVERKTETTDIKR
jgi:hypothetical protein